MAKLKLFWLFPHFSISPCELPSALGLIQASTVSPFGNRRFGWSGTRTWAVAPLKLKLCPTSPLVNAAPPYKIPELPSTASFALPPPFPQLPNPEAGGTLFVGFPPWHFPAPSAAKIACTSAAVSERL